MLMEYHNIFSLDENEIGCMDAAMHIIELLDEEPFKEKFQQIAPPLCMKSGNIFRRCWMVEPSSLHSLHGVMLWF